MKTRPYLTVIIVLLQSVCFSQPTTVKASGGLYLQPLLGYGTENNWGNRALFTGASLVKPIANHLFIEGGITYFTAHIPDGSRDLREGYNGAIRKYNALFLTPALGYTLGNRKSKFSVSIKAGPSLKYFDYKVYRSGQIRVYPDGREELVLESVRYWEDKGFNISLYNSLNIDARVTKDLRIGVFLDVYSGLIPIEHFMPGVNASFQLKKESSGSKVHGGE